MEHAIWERLEELVSGGPRAKPLDTMIEEDIRRQNAKRGKLPPR
jgi:hypothetical protein